MIKRAVLAGVAAGIVGWLGGCPFAEAREYDSVYFVDAQTGYVTGEDRLLRSTDGGQTWNILIGPGGRENVQDVSRLRFRSPSLGWFRDSDTKRVFLTTDGGQTWSPRSLTITLRPGVTDTVDFFEFASPTEAWGTDRSEGVYRSTDGGRTWQFLRVPDAFPALPGVMTFLDPMTGWLEEGNGVRATTDGGRTWGPPLGRPPVTAQQNGFRFLTSAVGWILGNDDRLYRTTDGGRTWVAPTLPVGPGTGKIFGFFFLTSDLGWASGKAGLLLKTTDGGTIWTVLPTGTRANLYGVHFVTEQLGWAVGNFNMILKTTDGGQTWKQMPDGEVNVDPSGRPNI